MRVPEWTRGERLAKARREAGFTVPEMAELLGVSEKTVYNYERDRPIRRSVLIVWASRCHVDYGWLETGEPSPAETPRIHGMTTYARAS